MVGRSAVVWHTPRAHAPFGSAFTRKPYSEAGCHHGSVASELGCRIDPSIRVIYARQQAEWCNQFLKMLALNDKGGRDIDTRAILILEIETLRVASERHH